MKHQFTFLLTATLFFSVFLNSCGETNLQKANKTGTTAASDVENNVKVPDLLDRGEKIQLGKEWDFVQNFYSDKKSQLAKNENDGEAYLQLAELFIKEARITGEHGHYYPAALRMTDMAVKNKEANPDLKFRALMTKAGVQLSLHEFSDALKTAQEAVKMNPNNAQIYGVLVDCYVELGEYDKAIAMADKMIAIKPDIRSYSRISYLREIHGDVDGSKKALGLAINAGFPGYEETAWAMLTLGELYERYGALDTAKQIYTEILDMRENYPFAISALGGIAYKEGNLKEAEKIQNQAIDIIPEVGYYTALAKIYKDEKRTEELDQLMSEIFLMLQEDVDSGHNMNLEYADIYLNILNEPEKSLKYALLEYDKRPLNIDVNRMLAQIYVTQGKNDLAKEHLQKASATKSIHPDLAELKKEIK